MGLPLNLIVITIIVIVLLFLIGTIFYLNKRTNFVVIQQIFRIGTTQSGSTTVYTVDGDIQPTITLEKDKAYRFVTDSPDFPFYFCTSDTGGPGTPGNLFPTISPISGAINIQIGDYLPDEFFYQSSITTNMGGKIKIK